MKNKRRSPISLFLGILLFGIICFGCDIENNDNGGNSDEYYIKYEANSTTIYSGVKLNVRFLNEKNQNTDISINARSPWEVIIGPVKKDFNSSLRVACDSDMYGTLKLYTQISVSKNNGPFALKKIDGSDISRASVQINYKIDF
jgi:hypothetical protein